MSVECNSVAQGAINVERANSSFTGILDKVKDYGKIIFMVDLFRDLGRLTKQDNVDLKHKVNGQIMRGALVATAASVAVLALGAIMGSNFIYMLGGLGAGLSMFTLFSAQAGMTVHNALVLEDSMPSPEEVESAESMHLGNAGEEVNSQEEPPVLVFE